MIGHATPVSSPWSSLERRKVTFNCFSKMNEPEVDDVAFLTGESVKKQALYRNNSDAEKLQRVSCSREQALLLTGIVFLVLLVISLIASFARPFPRCRTEGFPQVALSSSLAPIINLPTATNGEVFPWEDIRLPTFVFPIHYNIFMHPNLTLFENFGWVNITFQVKRMTDFIVLHIKEMNLTKVSLYRYDGRNIPVVQYLEYIKYEQLYVQFEEILEQEFNYTLHIDFNKHLEEKLEGFYISSYKSADGIKRYLATTHFEPTAARSAFPCFDEPSLKATFQLSIVHEASYKAYFNSEEQESMHYDSHLMLSRFQPTVVMSTYLVAFVVCDFQERHKYNADGIKVRVLVPKEQFNEAEFALNAAADILAFYHDFFNISYPLPKLDTIAIPDFGPGAMENWGLITFRMTTILYNPEETSSDAQEHVATVLAHELAHQWFGNLVTMQWWNDLWLNEGFASFMEYLGTNHVMPEWNMMDQFILSTTQDALSLDSLESSHPILTDVKDPIEIEAIFDAISYKKGAAILHMLENFLGLKVLRQGLTIYLNKYRFQNAKTEDLWDAFTQVSLKSLHLNVSEIMNTWIRQKGYPLITATRQGKKVKVEQKRFLLAPVENDEADPKDLSPYGYKWFVPITYTYDASDVVNNLWLNLSNGEFTVSEEASWFKVNTNMSGFYRVMYDTKSWKDLIEAFHSNHKKFHPAERASLLDDSFTLARVGILDSNLTLNLTLYLENEDDYVPWETAILHFDVLECLLQESYIHPLFQKYLLKLLRRVSNKLGWNDTGSHLTKKLRTVVLSSALRYNDKGTVQEATKRFNAWMKAGTKVAPNLRSVVYDGGVRYGGSQEWNFCWNKYQETQVPSEKRLLLAALGTTKDIWQLSQYLNYSLDKDKIRPQDTTLVVAVAARNPVGRLLTWRFIRSNWPKLLEMFGEGSFSMDMIISETISHFSTEFDYNEVKSFFSSVEVGSGMQSLHQSLERIRANINWKNNVQATVLDWIRKHMAPNI